MKKGEGPSNSSRPNTSARDNPNFVVHNIANAKRKKDSKKQMNLPSKQANAYNLQPQDASTRSLQNKPSKTPKNNEQIKQNQWTPKQAESSIDEFNRTKYFKPSELAIANNRYSPKRTEKHTNAANPASMQRPQSAKKRENLHQVQDESRRFTPQSQLASSHFDEDRYFEQLRKRKDAALGDLEELDEEISRFSFHKR